MTCGPHDDTWAFWRHPGWVNVPGYWYLWGRTCTICGFEDSGLHKGEYCTDPTPGSKLES